MMPTGQVFARMAAYGLVLSAADAVGGRVLHAAPDPSVVLPIGATAWAAYRLAEDRQARIAFPAAMTLWVSFMVGFVTCARLLVGWNGSLPWAPPSSMWAINLGALATVTAILAQLAGTRAAAARAGRPRSTNGDPSTPND